MTLVQEIKNKIQQSEDKEVFISFDDLFLEFPQVIGLITLDQLILST